MNGKVQIQLGGQTRWLWFNNYSREELGKVYGTDPLVAGKLFAEQLQANAIRAFSFLVWAGLMGHEYGNMQDPTYTKQEVAGWVATCEVDELMKVWDVWLDHSGMRELISSEKKSNQRTKKTSPGKRS